MFLHLGRNTIVPLKDIISIVKLEKNRDLPEGELLKTAEEQGFVIQLGQKPVSCVVTSKHIYLSPISVETLQKRMGQSYLTKQEIEF
ncbi:MAG: DUF370 domain-containing protein [Firmicutes bacterium]|nr:DUF370 domain-containing protein [Bacillota bacterium]